MRFVHFYFKLFIIIIIIISMLILLSLHHICGISHTRGNECRKYWPIGFESEGENE